RKGRARAAAGPCAVAPAAAPRRPHVPGTDSLPAAQPGRAGPYRSLQRLHRRLTSAAGGLGLVEAGLRPVRRAGRSPGHRGARSGIVLRLTVLLTGVAMLRRSRRVAYWWFERAVLLNLLLAQVFTFYLQQFGALAGLAIDLVLLLVLEGLMRTERRTARLVAG